MDRYDKMILLTVLKIVFKKDFFPGGKKPGNDLEISPVSPILYTITERYLSVPSRMAKPEVCLRLLISSMNS